MKLIFLHADKYEDLLQIYTMILMGIVKHFQSSQNRKFTMSLQYLIKEVRDEVDFLHVDKHQSFQQADFNTLGLKAAYKVILKLLLGMIKHCQSTQSNKFAISLQYLKKEATKGVHSCFGVLWLCKTFRYFMGVQPCLFLVSLHSETLEIFCLNTAIQ